MSAGAPKKSAVQAWTVFTEPLRAVGRNDRGIRISGMDGIWSVGPGPGRRNEQGLLQD